MDREPPATVFVTQVPASEKSSQVLKAPARKDAPIDQKFLHRKNSISHHAVMGVRARLTDEEQLRASSDMINQFLRATGGDQDHARRRLRETLRWREQERVERLLCSACLKQDGAHYMQVIGHDRFRRPVLYSCLALPLNRSVEDNKNHMIATFEQALRAMPKGTEQWVWISDFHGFGLRDTDPRLAKIFLDVSAKHYPERLGVFYCIDAPGMFSLLWKALQPMVDPVTRAKVRFLPYDIDHKGRKPSSLAKDLAENMDPPMAEWLVKEMAQNRSRKIAKRKVYPYAANFAHGDVRAVVDGHDCRGSEDFVDMAKHQPSVLLPPPVVKQCEELGKPINNTTLALF